MKFPSVKKAFGRIASAERISRGTVKLVGAALLTAGLLAAHAPTSQAGTGPEMRSTWAGGVIVIPAAPSVTFTDGTRQFSQHVSHSSHVSHGSHCSGAAYCG
jgi:hypothetical protein